MAVEDVGYFIYRADFFSGMGHVHIKEKFGKSGSPEGYITYLDKGDWTVKFLLKTDGGLAATHSVQFRAGGPGKTRQFKPPKPCNNLENKMAASWKAALNAISDSALCSSNYNPVVFPPENTSRDLWVVYLLPAAKDSKIIPAGGAYKITLEGAGMFVHSIERLNNSCIPLKKTQAAKYSIDHYLSDIPTEYHVYLSLFYNMNLTVEIAAQKWNISRGSITLPE